MKRRDLRPRPGAEPERHVHRSLRCAISVVAKAVIFWGLTFGGGRTVIAAGRAPNASSSAATSPSGDEAKRKQLLDLLQRKPSGLDLETWRVQRRETARKLGQLKEARAVPTLLQIVRRERFDVILERAIDALGEIGDPRAIAPLKRLLTDPTIDAYVRDATAKALAQLQAGGTAASVNKEGLQPMVDAASSELSGELATKAPTNFDHLPALRLPGLPSDLISRAEHFDLAAGTGSLRWDTRTQTTAANLNVSARYRRQVERHLYGYTVNANAGGAFSLDNPPGENNTSWNAQQSGSVAPEFRFYPFLTDLPQLFGQVSGGVNYGLNLAHPANGELRTAFGSTVSLGFGAGYGRVFDVGSRLRLRRLMRVLRRAGALNDDKIDRATATRLMQLWYKLRNTVGTYPQLGYTLQILQEANLLSSSPAPAATYQLIRILDDPQLIGRPSGLMFRGGYGYAHDFVTEAEDRDLGFIYATGQWHLQRGTTRAFSAEMRFFWDHLTPGNTFNLNLSSSYDWYLYNRAFDPLGSVGLTATAGVSDQPGAAFRSGGVAYQLLGGINYRRIYARASRFTTSLQAGFDRRGTVVLLTLEANYGIAAGSIALQ